MRKELPQHLIREIQKHTGTPWWNVEAYDGYKGLSSGIRQRDDAIGAAIDDLWDVMQWLREEKLYAQSDRIRTIAGRLARARGPNPHEDPQLIRQMARNW